MLAERKHAERPSAQQGLVRRESLFQKLSGADADRVLLVCAPAGSGKSVLVRSWAEAARIEDRLAWVSIDRGERDAQRFWLSVISALAKVIPGVASIAPAPSFRGELVVERLVSELGSLEEQVVLVIDDLHELGSVDALSWLELLLTRLPRSLRVVLVTRRDPRLGLHRLRLSGDLTELRAPDLTFSLDETRQLIEASGIPLSDAGLALLHERTEGWAAGLRLAAISLLRHSDPERFVREFSGSERTVAGYLMEEVLERQPAEVREMLLRTSVLDRVSGALADFLTGGAGSERILQELEDANAFVSSLDVGRSWFRYHHLFAELLQLELRRVSPTMVATLHRAAAAWYEQHGYVVEAIRHAQAARDWSHASRLLADNYLDLIYAGRTATVRELLGALTGDAGSVDPEVALVFSAVRLLAGEREESAACIDLARRLAHEVPEERRRRFDLQLAEMALVLGRWQGDIRTVLEAMRSVETALDALPPNDRGQTDELRAVVLQNLGVAELWSSRPEDARRDLEHALALARHAQRPWLEIAALGHLGIAGPWTGLPVFEALQQSQEALRIANSHGWDEDPVVVPALATGAMTLLWLGRLDEAEEWLDRAQHTLQPGGEPGTELLVHHARGLLSLAWRRSEEALQAFLAAEHMQSLLADEHPFALRTRARLLQTRARMGQVAEAYAGLADISESDRATAPMRVTHAVIQLEEGNLEPALETLAPVLEGAVPPLHRSVVMTEARVLEAAALERLSDRRGAQASLEQALELAEPDGMVLPFILTPLPDLLTGLPRHRTSHATLLRTILEVLAGSSSEAPRQAAPLLEEISEAELRVIRYLPSNLKAPEIASELFVSANTVRTHIRHIYAKLGVHDRNEAVARARELGLLAPSMRVR